MSKSKLLATVAIVSAMGATGAQAQDQGRVDRAVVPADSVGIDGDDT